MGIEKQKWKLPSADDGSAWMVRSTKAEEHLRESLNLLYYIKESIPQIPASESKSIIENHLSKFR